MTDEQKKLLEGLDVLLSSDLEDMISFSTDTKQSAPIKITIRGRRLPEETEDFAETLRRLADDFLVPKGKLTSRLLSDLGTSRRKKSKSEKTTAILQFFNQNLAYIDTDFKDIPKISGKPIRNLTVEDSVRLLEHVYYVWKEMPVRHRTPRQLRDRAVRGYFKQREENSHDEIIKAIQTYGKWAKAYELALDAGEQPDVFWFNPWKFEQFLTSNKVMDHVGDGWKAVVRDKKIPSEYAQEDAMEQDSKVFKRNVEYIANGYMQYGEYNIDDTNAFNKSPELKAAVEARVKELQNAA